jgi:hypothetical protein
MIVNVVAQGVLLVISAWSRARAEGSRWKVMHDKDVEQRNCLLLVRSQVLKLFVRRCEELWMRRCGAMHAA